VVLQGGAGVMSKRHKAWLAVTTLGRRIVLLAAAALGAVGFTAAATAQVATTPLEPGSAPGWTFAVTPYVWLPTLSSTVSLNGPRGGTVTTDLSAGVGDYLSKLNFGLMGGAEARYGPITVMTDLIYANVSLTTGNSRLSTFNPGSGPIIIPIEQQVSTGTRLATTIWSLAGGYTLAGGEWGNIDVVVGMRMLFVSDTTDYALTSDILLPDRTIGLSRIGGFSLSRTLVEGVGGVKGRINIPNSRFYIPFYADAGGGSAPVTWQLYSGIGYQAATWADVSVGYRYLRFAGNTGSGVQNLSLGGVLLAANFRF
jgi:hypothetical protein